MSGYPIFTPQGQQQLERLRIATAELEGAWQADEPDEATRLQRITALSRDLEEASLFEPDWLSDGLRNCLALEGCNPPFRLSLADEAFRLRAEPGLDLRLQPEGDQLLVQGRRRPRFELIEYLTTTLGPGLTQEVSRRESMEGLVTRERS